jgi:extracellular elastinolytic metalloproteinase
MSEGWSDFFAAWMRMKPTDEPDKKTAMAEYVNGGKGLRTYSYSTSMSNDDNPTTYGLVFTKGWREHHKIGEIWANMLYEVYWSLVVAHGFDEKRYRLDENQKKNKSQNKGNVLALMLVVDALALQPCNPTFVQARDAIIAADLVITKAVNDQATSGANECLLWKAFAKRGLGFGAASDGESKVMESKTLPPQCQKA